MNTQTRYFPQGAIIVRPKDLPGVEIALISSDSDKGTDRCYAIGYQGRKIKPSFHYRFDSPAQREKHIAKFLESCRKLNEVRAERRQSRKFESNPCEVGQIFVSTWGYEQTNVDFYQVTEVKGMSVIIRSIRSRVTRYTGDMSNYVTALPDEFLGSPMLKRISRGYDGQPHISLSSYSSAGLWDGKEMYESHYA